MHRRQDWQYRTADGRAMQGARSRPSAMGTVPPVTEQAASDMHVNTLKERIARDDYVVDHHAVAEALVRDAGARRTILALPALTPRDVGSRAARAVSRPR